jgi:16S rRNA (guanine527-N7)-methyltransferase
MAEGSALRLNELLSSAGVEPLQASVAGQFAAYLSLILKWNDRVNLTSIRDEEGILQRHFVESIFCAQALPAGIQTLLDFGSGAGLPGIPIALCRPEIAVTLAESQGKKAAFLREAARVLGVSVVVRTGRAETLAGQFGCVTLRAVERMREAVGTASQLVLPGGFMALMIGSADQAELRAAAAGFAWREGLALSFSREGLLLIGEQSSGLQR